MIHIQVDSEYWSVVKTPDVRQAAKVAAAVAEIPSDAEFTVVVTGDEEVKTLNSEFRHVEDTTDVLSFPASEENPENGKGYLGDVIISFPRAQKQAALADHPTSYELALLVVHGVLHLAGYDHMQPEDEKIMFKLQNQALDRLNVRISGFNA